MKRMLRPSGDLPVSAVITASAQAKDLTVDAVGPLTALAGKSDIAMLEGAHVAVEKANAADETSIGGETGTTKLDVQPPPGIVVSAARKVLERDEAGLILRNFVHSAAGMRQG